MTTEQKQCNVCDRIEGCELHVNVIKACPVCGGNTCPDCLNAGACASCWAHPETGKSLALGADLEVPA